MSDKATWPPAIPEMDMSSIGLPEPAPALTGTEPLDPHHDSATSSASTQHAMFVEDPDDFGRSAPKGERAEIGQPYVRLSRLAIFVGLLIGLGLWQGPRILVIVAAVIVMIFFHELGHFVMARRADMKVTEFMIGFGPRIFSFRKGDVEYGLKAIPAGAYVKIIGMADVEEVPPADEPRTYRQKGYWARMGVAVAGSAMHFIMALALIGASFMFVGVGEPSNWLVNNVSAGSAAERAGVQNGDRILSFGGVEVESFQDMARQAQQSPDEDLAVVVERDGQQVTLEAQITSRFYVVGTNGNEVQVYGNADGEPAIGVNPDNGAVESGVLDGAVIVAVNGTVVTSGVEIASIINKGDGTANTSPVFTLRSEDGAVADVAVPFGNQIRAEEPRGFFGVGQEMPPVTYSPVKAVGESFVWFADVTRQTVSGVANFFTPSNLWGFVERVFTTTPDGGSDEPTEATSNANRAQANLERESQRMVSIVGAVSLGDKIAENGWGNVLQFLALLNMAIGIFNLMPLPPFDGGHVLIGTYERIRELLRRDGRRYFADYNKVMPVAMGVIIVMVAIGLMAIYLDLADPVQI